MAGKDNNHANDSVKPDEEPKKLTTTAGRPVADLQSGELDASVVSLPIQSPDIICSELFREDLCLIVPLNQGHCLRGDVLTACTRARVEFESVFETDQLASIFPLVATGFGISFRKQAHEGVLRLAPHSAPDFD